MLYFAIIIAGLLACFAGLFWTLASRFDAEQCTADWLDRFSLKTYAPMERLLEKSDAAFLESQPGYRKDIASRLMAERRSIFRGYLRLLVRDFNQLIGIGKLMVVYSKEDQQEFARSLWRQQVQFYTHVCTLHVQLALHPLGWTTVDASGLLASLGAMRSKVQELASSGGGSAIGQMA